MYKVNVFLVQGNVKVIKSLLLKLIKPFEVFPSSLVSGSEKESNIECSSALNATTPRLEPRSVRFFMIEDSGMERVGSLRVFNIIPFFLH